MKDAPSRKKKPRRGPLWYRLLGGIWYAGVVAAACGAGVVANMASRSSIVGLIVSNPFALLNTDPKETFHTQDGLTLLILGTDDDRVVTGWAVGPNGKEHGISKVTRRGARADMILVARLDFAHNRITGLSVPRDTGCRLPGYSTKKINAYYSVAPVGQGKEYMQRAVEHVMPGVHVDRTVALNYDAFKDLVDTVGGVPVVVQKGKDGKGLQYDDYAGELHVHLSPGPHTLNGEDAMGYVRYRHDRESDYGRQERQKEFLASFKGSVLGNLGKLPEIAEQGKVVLDNALTDKEIIALVAFARSVPPTSIKMGMLPTTEGRGSMLRVDEAHRDKALRESGLAGIGGTSTEAPR